MLEKITEDNKPWRDNDLSAWKNYGIKKGYSAYLKLEIIEEYLRSGEFKQKIGMLRQMLNERTNDKLLTNEDLETFLLK